MTTDDLAKQIGVPSNACATVISVTTSPGYIASDGRKVSASNAQGYVYAVLSELSIGDVLHVSAKATSNVSIIARTNGNSTDFVPAVIGSSSSTYTDYYHVVSSDCVYISSYDHFETVEIMHNAVSDTSGSALYVTNELARIYGIPQVVSNPGLFNNPQENKFIHVSGVLVDEVHYRVTRPIIVGMGDIVYLKTRLTQKVAAISMVTGDDDDIYIPLVNGHTPNDSVPAEYRYFVKTNMKIVLSYYIGNEDNLPYEGCVFHSDLMESMIDYVDLENCINLSSYGSGNLTTAMFGNQTGRTFIIDRVYQCSENPVIIPLNSTLVYKGNGKIVCSGDTSIKFQNTILKGSVRNMVNFAAGSTIANSVIKTSWFCPVNESMTTIQQAARLNELIRMMDCQTLSFDQDYMIEANPAATDYHFWKDGLQIKSNIRFSGNGHTLTVGTGHSVLSTQTYGDSPNSIYYNTVRNVDIHGFVFSMASGKKTQEIEQISPADYSVVNIGSGINVCIYDCNFSSWIGTAINMSFVYYINNNNYYHFTAPIDGITVADCSFTAQSTAASYLGNGITVSNGINVTIERCSFANFGVSGHTWPGPIDFEAESDDVHFENIRVRNCVFYNSGARAPVNFASQNNGDITINNPTLKNVLIENIYSRISVIGISIVNITVTTDSDKIVTFRNCKIKGVSSNDLLKTVSCTNLAIVEYDCDVTTEL